ncbi:heterochromatin protein 1-like protein, partial [Dinothrombium tinctorium]
MSRFETVEQELNFYKSRCADLEAENARLRQQCLENCCWRSRANRISREFGGFVFNIEKALNHVKVFEKAEGDLRRECEQAGYVNLIDDVVPISSSPPKASFSSPKFMKLRPRRNATIREPSSSGEQSLRASASSIPPKVSGTLSVSNDEYAVEMILAKRFNCKENRVEYLVKWEGFDHEENSWEPEGNLNCDQLL